MKKDLFFPSSFCRTGVVMFAIRLAVVLVDHTRSVVRRQRLSVFLVSSVALMDCWLLEGFEVKNGVLSSSFRAR